MYKLTSCQEESCQLSKMTKICSQLHHKKIALMRLKKVGFQKMACGVEKLSGLKFLPPGRKPYPRNTFFWASWCSSLCFDPGVMSILTASVHTSHILAPWKRSCSKCYAMHWMSLHTSHMLAPWKHSCSKCYGMDCLGTYFTHAQT